jgi:hypothetical protein
MFETGQRDSTSGESGRERWAARAELAKVMNEYLCREGIMRSSLNREGQQAVPFELSDTTGRVHRLEDYRDRWLLLMFHRHLS